MVRLTLISNARFKYPGRDAFWFAYRVFGDSRRFCRNYIEAWWQQTVAEQAASQSAADPVQSLLLFRDNRSPLLVPCGLGMTDRKFVDHIRAFYCFDCFRDGILRALSLKSVSYVELVNIEDRFIVGGRHSVLELGRMGSSNGRIDQWLNPGRLSDTDTTISSRLKADGVIADTAPHATQPPQQPGQTWGSHTRALNVVTSWNIEVGIAAGIGLLNPSLFYSVAWSVILPTAFRADVNASVQTEFYNWELHYHCRGVDDCTGSVL